VEINLPSYTSIETGPDWDRYCANVLNFIEAFNKRYGASAGVRIVSFSPTRVYVSGEGLPDDARLKQADAGFVALSKAVKNRTLNLGPQFRLGITQADSIVKGVGAVAHLNSLCKTAGTPLFTIFNIDSEDPNVHGDLKGSLSLVGHAAKGTGITTVTLAGGPSLTASKLSDVFLLPPIEGITYVGVPEIYDIEYSGCTFPPPLCAKKGCAKPTVTPQYIRRGVEALFSAKACTTEVGLPPSEAFLTVNTPYFQTWPGFSIQQPSACFDPPGTITGLSQVGCNNLSTFTVAEFVEFAQAFAERTAIGRQSKGVVPYSAPVPIMLYEAAYIPLSWMKQLGVAVK
jgi:hypothetical protein